MPMEAKGRDLFIVDNSVAGWTGILEKAFQRKNPLFTLPMYYPLAWYKGPDKTIDPFEQNRQKQVVGLIRTNFLKRFESSVAAFEMSCDRLLKKLIAFVQVHSASEAEKKRLERWKTQNAEILGYAVQRHLDFFVVALNETIRLMQGIDAVIDEHGGWPGAFVQTTGEQA